MNLIKSSVSQENGIDRILFYESIQNKGYAEIEIGPISCFNRTCIRNIALENQLKSSDLHCYIRNFKPHGNLYNKSSERKGIGHLFIEKIAELTEPKLLSFIPLTACMTGFADKYCFSSYESTTLRWEHKRPQPIYRRYKVY